MLKRYVVAVMLTVVIACPALAAPTKLSNEEQDFFFSADDVSYNDQTKVLRATGNVEITNGERVVQADTLIYDEARKQIIAKGHVAAVEPTGDVIFADTADLSDDFNNVFARNVGILLVDKSRMTARVAERVDGAYVNMAQATYSPCDLCKDDPSKPPLWKLTAERVHHSMVTHDVTYEEAWLHFDKTPVLYMPRFSHPDPSVKSRTGFLTPKFGYGSNIGLFSKIPYFFDIQPDLDITITPTISEEDGLQMAGEFRKRWRDSSLKLEGSHVNADLTEEDGRVRDNQSRGHVKGEFKYDINEYWRTGGDVFLTSDKNYLDRYRIGAPDVLTNRAFLEGFRKRDYISLDTYYFQDTRPGIRQSQPYVIPRLRAEALGAPDSMGPLGGRWKLRTEVASLERPKEKLDTRRVSASGGWERTDIMSSGLVSTINTDARVDSYVSDHYVEPGTTAPMDETEKARAFPSAQLTLRYPLARQFGTVQQTLEPIVAAFTAPTVDDDGIPNEDSRDFEFDHTNLFRASRFTGVDRLEGGTRITYGIRTGIYGFGGGSGSVFLGQSQRLIDETSFSSGSGLYKKSSDYVGNVTLDPAPWLFFDYNFRIDQATLQSRKHDMKMVVGSNPLRWETNYIFIDELAGTANGESREEVASSLNYYFARYWNVFAGQSRSFQPTSTPLTTSLGLNYVDECISFGITASRDHTVRQGLESGDSVFVRLILKNLGGIETPLEAGNVFDSERNR